jgi:riboflavin kinase/FMN adenylyltransferase
MLVQQNSDPRDTPARGCVVSIGVFDGVHRGHRRVLEKLRETGARLALPTVAVTFDPHPRLVLQPDRSLPMLVSLRRRLSLLGATGNVDRCVVLPFDQRQREQSAGDFVQETLVGQFGMRALVVGENFVCGRGRVGTVDYLRKLGKRLGFAVHAVKMDMPHGDETGTPSSSTEVRRLIQVGQITRAAALLGRPHELECMAAGGPAQDSCYELMLPTGMCIPAAGTYTALLSTHEGLSTRASMQLSLSDDTGSLRCFLNPVNCRLDVGPGTPVIAQFLDMTGTGSANNFPRVLAA